MLFVYQNGQSLVSLDTSCTQLLISLPQSCLATLLTQPSPLPPWPSCSWGEHIHLCGTKQTIQQAAMWATGSPGLWGLQHSVKGQKGQRYTPDPSLGW